MYSLSNRVHNQSATNEKRLQAKHNDKVGEMVLISDHTTPTLHWKIGRVNEVFAGRDNKVRVMTVDLTHADIVYSS